MISTVPASVSGTASNDTVTICGFTQQKQMFAVVTQGSEDIDAAPALGFVEIGLVVDFAVGYPDVEGYWRRRAL